MGCLAVGAARNARKYGVMNGSCGLKIALRSFHLSKGRSSIANRIRQALVDFDEKDASSDLAPVTGTFTPNDRYLIPPEPRSLEPTELLQPPGTASSVPSAKMVTNQAVRLMLKNDLSGACDMIIGNLPFDEAISAFTETLIPTAFDRKVAFPVYRVMQILESCGQAGIGAQVAAGTAQDLPKLIKDLEIWKSVSRVRPDPKALDAVLVNLSGLRYPQILWAQNQSLWLRTQILKHMTSGDRKHFQLMLQRYLPLLLSRDVIGELTRDAPKQVRSDISGALISMEASSKGKNSPQWWDAMEGLLETATTGSAFQQLWRNVKKLGPSPQFYDLLLYRAMKLELSYELSNVAIAASHVLSPKQLADAISTLMWSQRLRDPRTTNDGSLSLAENVQTDLVSRTIRALPPSLAPAVISRALGFLLNTQPSGHPVPPQPLWALLLGIQRSPDIVMKPSLVSQLARAVSTRPHLEQIRYMALPLTTASAVSYLLRQNAARISKGRKEHRVPDSSLESDADVQIMLAGMILMSEKLETAADRSVGVQLSRVVLNVAAKWNVETAATLLAGWEKYQAPLPGVSLATIGMLVKSRNFPLAIQVMQSMDASKVPPPVFHSLLLSVAHNFPDISTHLVTWLIRGPRVFIPPKVMRQMIEILSRSKKMGDQDIDRRVHILVKVLKSGGHNLTIPTATAIVEGLLTRASQNGGGSRKRLQWALGLCKDEHVPQEQVQIWLAQINTLHAHHVYWT